MSIRKTTSAHSGSTARAEAPRTTDKICSLSELAAHAAQARQSGKTVVQSHGVFDLLHHGHVLHLEAARKLGDLLIVTITADRFVNKGPGRPAFPAAVRAKMLAALEVVDYVAVNDSAMALPALEAIQPSIYAKGSDYANAQDDVTGGIAIERAMVERHGGRLLFTDEETQSSSTLINKYLALYPPALAEHLASLRERDALPQILAAIDHAQPVRVLLVGDSIIEDYQHVRPMAKSPTEARVATQFCDRELFAGGVLAAANHLAPFCATVDVLTVLGSEDSFREVATGALKGNVRFTALERPNAPTTRKCRFIEVAGGLRTLFEVDVLEDSPLQGALEQQWIAMIEQQAKSVDLVIVTDFGHGLMTSAVIQTLRAASRFLAVYLQTNDANYGYNGLSRYRGADYLVVDSAGARLAAGDKRGEIGTLLGTHLSALVPGTRLAVTQGADGCSVFDGHTGVRSIPAVTTSIVDSLGAGAAFLAVTAPLVAAGLPLDLVGLVGNAVGAIKGGIVGHRQSVEKAPLIKFLTALLK